MPKQFVEEIYSRSSYYRKTRDRISYVAKKLDVSYAAARYRLLELKLITQEQFDNSSIYD